jgi:hypothetical protein
MIYSEIENVPYQGNSRIKTNQITVLNSQEFRPIAFSAELSPNIFHVETFCPDQEGTYKSILVYLSTYNVHFFGSSLHRDLAGQPAPALPDCTLQAGLKVVHLRRQ